MSDQQTPQKFQLSWGAISFIEAPSSRLLLFAIMSIIVTLASVITASFFININVSVMAVGEIDSLIGVSEAVALSAGELYRLPAQEGDQVSKDQVIGWIKMGNSSFDQVASVYKDLQKRVDSLNDSSSLRPTISAAEISDPEIRNQLIDTNKKLSTLKYIEGQWLTNGKSEIKPLEARLLVLDKQLQYISKSNVQKYLQMQKGQLQEEKGRIVQQIRALQNSIETKTYDARSDAEQALRNSLAKVQQYLVDHQVKAPVSGRVARVPVNEGSFIKAGDSIASIIPDGGEMVAKVLVSSKDITFVSAGNKVYIAIDAYPAHKFGYFEGEVIGVDKVKVRNEKTSTDGYVARVRIDINSLSRNLASVDAEVANKNIQLVPGMKVEARVLVHRAPIATLIIDKIFGKEL